MEIALSTIFYGFLLVFAFWWYYRKQIEPTVVNDTLTEGQVKLVLKPPGWMTAEENRILPSDHLQLTNALLSANVCDDPYVVAMNNLLAAKQISIGAYITAILTHNTKIIFMQNNFESGYRTLAMVLSLLFPRDHHNVNTMTTSATILVMSIVETLRAHVYNNIPGQFPAEGEEHTCLLCQDATHVLVRQCDANHVYCQKCAPRKCILCEKETQWTISQRCISPNTNRPALQ